jgi:hypothetical protein
MIGNQYFKEFVKIRLRSAVSPPDWLTERNDAGARILGFFEQMFVARGRNAQWENAEIHECIFPGELYREEDEKHKKKLANILGRQLTPVLKQYETMLDDMHFFKVLPLVPEQLRFFQNSLKEQTLTSVLLEIERFRLTYYAYFVTPMSPFAKQEDSGVLARECLVYLERFVALAKARLEAETAHWEPVPGGEPTIFPDNREAVLSLTEFYGTLKRLLHVAEAPELERVRQEFFRIVPRLDKFETASAYYLLVSAFSNRILREGGMEARTRLLMLYREGIESGIFSNGHWIVPNTFISVVQFLCASGEPDEAQDFLERHKRYLLPEVAGAVGTFCEGLLLFQHARYSEARAVFESTEKTRLPEINLRGRAYRCKCYYEQYDQLEPWQVNVFHSTLDGTDRYLSETVVGKAQADAYRHFYKGLKQMLRVKNAMNRQERATELNKLKKLMANRLQTAAFQGWLLKKGEALGKNE